MLAAETAGAYATFVCEADFDWVQDGTRESRAAQAWFHRLVKDDLAARGIEYVSLTGTLEERIERVERELAQSGWIRSPESSLG